MAETYYAVFDREDKGNVVCKLTGPNPTLNALADAGQIARWSFFYTRTSGRRYLVYVYHRLLSTAPQGEELEKINQKAVNRILKTPEVPPDKFSLWGASIGALLIAAALILYQLKSNGLLAAVIMGAIMFLIPLYRYYTRRRP